VLPEIVAEYAMYAPSGEKYGSVSSDGVLVSRRALPPARGTTQRSPPYSKATLSWLTVGLRKSLVPCAMSDVLANATSNGATSK
jgi:hypothetical protein